MKKNIYQFRAWEGVDVCNATSLKEYGFLFNPKPKKNFYNIVYGISHNGEEFTRFVYSSVDWNSILSEDWIKWEKVAQSCGCTIEEIKEFSLSNLHSLVSYYGFEEIFGSNYDSGFEVNG